jgi:hypothetical protein
MKFVIGQNMEPKYKMAENTVRHLEATYQLFDYMYMHPSYHSNNFIYTHYLHGVVV